MPFHRTIHGRQLHLTLEVHCDRAVLHCCIPEVLLRVSQLSTRFQLHTNSQLTINSNGQYQSQHQPWADCSMLSPLMRPTAQTSIWLHQFVHRVSKKTSTHIIGYKLRNSCPILIIFDIKIPQII